MSDIAKRDVLRPRLEVIKALSAQVGVGGRWCVWLPVEREGGKLGKVPHQFKSGKFSPIGCDNPTEWADFEKICVWYGGGTKASGLGLLIGGGKGPERYHSGLVAVDIDHCIADGELVATVPTEVRLAIKAMTDAGVYLEISPSGTGLRGIWRGSKGPGIREKIVHAGIGREMYDGSTNGRYVTVTGATWGESAPVLRELPESFAWDVADSLGLLVEQVHEGGSSASAPLRDLPGLSDDAIIAKLKQSGQGKGKRLWDGDMSDYGNDWSSADAALCRTIARWTDDEAQVARVWGASALAQREKFKVRKDYRSRTVTAALTSARKEAAEKSSTSAAKSAKVQAAIESGDSGGALAEALSRWGGKVPATLEAAETIISYDRRLCAAFAFDAFCSGVVKLRSLRECLGEAVPPDDEPRPGDTWKDSDTLALTIWLAKEWGVSLKPGQIDDAVSLAARRRPINLVVDALEVLKWDGKPRLDTWLIDYLQADDSYDSARYLKAIGRAWVIGTVARAYQPGVKFDNALVLEGGQGRGKSNAARILASAVAPHAFREGLPSLAREDEAQMALRGVWICELSELAFQGRSSAEHTKSFISRLVDSFRPKYGRRDDKVPRTVSFIGTTNHSQYVQDASGARRWWSFRVSKPIDIEALLVVAPQLWAEGVAAFKAGEKHHITDAAVLTDAQASQSVRQERSGWDELIEDKLIDPLTEGKLGEPSEFYEQALRLWVLVAGDEAKLEFTKNTRAFSEALTRCGFEKKVSGGRSMWRVGADLMGRIHKSRL